MRLALVIFIVGGLMSNSNLERPAAGGIELSSEIPAQRRSNLRKGAILESVGKSSPI